MERESNRVESGTSTRRRVLAAVAAGGAAGIGGLAGCISSGSGGTPTPREPPTFALSTVQSGPYGRIGRKERNGFEMAVDHINNGGGLVDAGAFDALTGDGLLGHEVETATFDSEGSADVARSKLTPRVDGGNATMICGGVRADVVRAHRDLASEHGVPFMAGTTLLDELAGEQCSATTYRELYSSGALMRGLGPTLADEVGESVVYYQLYTDAPEGEDLKDAVNGYFSGADSPNWQPRGNEAIRSGSTSFEEVFERATSGRPGAIFLNLFGIDAINALSAAADVVSDDVQIVVPVIDDSLEYVVGSGVADVIGTVPWDPSIDAEYADAYDSAYVAQYGRSAGGEAESGSGTAHVTYVQTLQYAAAAERAGSYNADDIRSELEGHQYAVGAGDQQIQACNHQSDRAVPVVRGTSSRGANGNHFELLAHADGVIAGCDESPASSCSL